MRYRTLGASGCAVSALALGTMTFGSETDEVGSHAQLDRFVEAGGTLIDTADVYSGTESESIIGRWLAKQPAEVKDQVVIATKGRFPTGPGQRPGLVAAAPGSGDRCFPAPPGNRVHRLVPGP